MKRFNAIIISSLLKRKPFFPFHSFEVNIMLNFNQKIKNFLRLTCREFMGMVVSIPLFTVILGAQNDFDTRKKIDVPEPIYGCYFGSKILLQDEHLLISAPGYPDGSSFGAVYAYSFKDGLPVLRQKITNESGYSGEYFGQEMAIDGTVLAVSGGYRGRDVYIYRYNGFTWVKEQTLNWEGEYSFGYKVSVSGDRMVVGTYPNDCPANRAFVYRYNGTEWEMETILQPEGDPEIPEIGFGRGVAIDGKTLAIGAPDEGGDFRGRIHLFEYDGAIWQPTDVISTNQSGIGESIELSSDLLVMGNPWAGIITIYRRIGNEWMFEQDITPSSADFWSNDGSHISISNDMIAVGIGPYEGSVNQVYLFKYERNRWDEKYVFTEDDF